jgi:Ca2+-dependent lipid-binding protein
MAAEFVPSKTISLHANDDETIGKSHTGKNQREPIWNERVEVPVHANCDQRIWTDLWQPKPLDP